MIDYVPLWVGGAIRGRVRRDLIDIVAACPGIERVDPGLRLRDAG